MRVLGLKANLDWEDGRPVFVEWLYECWIQDSAGGWHEWGWVQERQCWPCDPEKEYRAARFEDGSAVHFSTLASNKYTAMTGNIAGMIDANRYMTLTDAAGKTIYFPTLDAAIQALKQLGYANKLTTPF